MLFPAVIYSPVYAGNLHSNGMITLNYLSVVMLIFGIIGLVKKSELKNKAWNTGSILVIIASIGLFVLTRFNVFKDSPIFQGPTVNRIVVWALICAAIAIFINVYGYLFRRDYEYGLTSYDYGLGAKGSSILISFVVAVIVSAVSFLILFLIDKIFLTDFRIWTVAFKTFDTSHLLAALKYMPFFFIYYLVAGAGSVINSAGRTGWKSYLLAVLINVGGITLWLILQYGKLFATGVAQYPNDALSGILLIALVPTLAFAFINTKYLYDKNKNIYLPAFINTIMLTFMTVANTAIYFQ